VLLALALVTVGIGWWLDREVVERRDVRAQATDAALLQSGGDRTALFEAAHQARLDFNRWHGYSVWVNLGTFLLVTLAMALAAQLPIATVAPTLASRDEAPPAAPPPPDPLLSHSHRLHVRE
jgi:hypothetical protein